MSYSSNSVCIEQGRGSRDDARALSVALRAATVHSAFRLRVRRPVVRQVLHPHLAPVREHVAELLLRIAAQPAGDSLQHLPLRRAEIDGVPTRCGVRGQGCARARWGEKGGTTGGAEKTHEARTQGEGSAHDDRTT